MVEINKTPEPNKVVGTLFEQFCEDCEWGEEGCMQAVGARCPVFDAVMAIVPDNPFVVRIMGRLMRCSNCSHIGMTAPETAYSGPQPFLVCLSCGAPVWRDAYGVLVTDAEFAGQVPETVEIKGGDGSVVLRVGCHRKKENS